MSQLPKGHYLITDKDKPDPTIVFYENNEFTFIGNEQPMKENEFLKLYKILCRVSITKLLIETIKGRETEISWLEQFGNKYRSESFLFPESE